MTRVRRLWDEWWMRSIIVVILIAVVAECVARVLHRTGFVSDNWAEGFSGNLWADLLVAVAVGVVVLTWQQQAQKAREEQAKQARVVSLVLQELLSIQVLLYQAEVGQSVGQAILVHPLPMSAWEAITGGSLFESVPVSFSKDILAVYSGVKRLNNMAGQLTELTAAAALAVDPSEDPRSAVEHKIRTVSSELGAQVFHLSKRLVDYVISSG